MSEQKPGGIYGRNLHIRLSERMQQELAELSVRLDRPRAEIVRDAIREAIRVAGRSGKESPNARK